MDRRRNTASAARHAGKLRGSDSTHPARAAVLAVLAVLALLTLLTGIARDLASHSPHACERDRMIA